MTTALVRKYGRALADVTLELGRADEALAELRAFGALLDAHADLYKTLINPALPFARKRAIVELVAPRSSLSQPVVNFILILLKSARLKQYAQFIEGYEAALDERRGVIRGTVYSAGELDKLARARLQDLFGKKTGKQVRLDFRQDESLIGGVKVLLDSTVFDGSIRSQLDQIKERLAGE
jgi:F-type H+-transporting ATPase subunit delta